MKQITLKEINNAFIPAKEITEVEKFSGRKIFVEMAYHALLSDGANIAIVGNRGIGKSSLARQIINIGQGDNSLLSKLDIYHDTHIDCLCVYFACGSSISSTNDLLSSLLSSNSALSDGFYELQTSTKSSSKINGGVDVGVSLLKAKLGADLNHEKTTTSAIKAHTVEMIFQNVIMNILSMKKNKDGILIVIDEFDQITDATGFASYLKSLATNTPGLKFCIVGVAQNI